MDINGFYGSYVDHNNKIYSFGDISFEETGLEYTKKHSMPLCVNSILTKCIKSVKTGRNFGISIGLDQSLQSPIEQSLDMRSLTPIMYRSISTSPLDSDRMFTQTLRSPLQNDISQKRYELLKQDLLQESELRKNAQRELEKYKELKIRNIELIKELETRSKILQDAENELITEKNQKSCLQLELKNKHEELKFKDNQLFKMQNQLEKQEIYAESIGMDMKNQIEMLMEREKGFLEEIESLNRERNRWIGIIEDFRNENQALNRNLAESSRSIEELMPSITEYQSKLSILQQENEKLLKFIKKNSPLSKKLSQANPTSTSQKSLRTSPSTPSSPKNSAFSPYISPASPTKTSLEDLKIRLKTIHLNKNSIENRMQLLEEKLRKI